MDITAKFQEEFYGYKDYEERMGNKLKFDYNVDECKVTIYSEVGDTANFLVNFILHIG